MLFLLHASEQFFLNVRCLILKIERGLLIFLLFSIQSELHKNDKQFFVLKELAACITAGDWHGQ